MSDEGVGEAGKRSAAAVAEVPGIVIADGRSETPEARMPRIEAFIWGGKVRPTPTLPYGRWKGAA
ncbi:MAG TPA: hypothetical protein VGA70_08470 [Longimicrobiales bacterium]|jgi:hypothetical protein